MKILLDECVPKKLKRYFTEHEVWTAPEAGWAGKKNGALIALAAGRFSVLVTVDKDIPYQQNIRTLDIMVIVLIAEDNDIRSLLPLVPALRKELENLRPGQFVFVGP
ncbi:MAG: DUF5615 family PIN-like protein [Candidatus Acidiferrales bacterium]